MKLSPKDIIGDLVFMQNGNDGPDGVKDAGGVDIVNFDNPILPVPSDKYGPVDKDNSAVLEGDGTNNANWFFLLALAAGIAYVANPKKASISVPVVLLGGLGAMLLNRQRKATIVVPSVEHGQIS
jgi:hypothetical protein